MATPEPPRAWLVIAAGDDRGHGGNEGYDDQVDSYYSWNSNVQNASQLREGDAIALWDKRQLLGVSVIEKIDKARGTSLFRRCPACRTTRIRERDEGLWRCSKCAIVFAEPITEARDVTTYTARYDAAWTPLDGLMGAKDLRPLQEKPKSFNSMRELNWERFGRALVDRRAPVALARLVARSPEIEWQARLDLEVRFPQGHGHAFVRVRHGQEQFRHHLLANQGEVCAFTGAAPARALEAGHLYSYGKLGTHYEHGGLMLRRDVHRLFDDGSLAVNPGSLRIDVASSLSAYAQYARLDGSPLTLRLRDEQVEWLAQHWDEHRVASAPSG